MRAQIDLLYDFALAEGDEQLAKLLAAHLRTGAPTSRSEFAESAVERIGRRIGLIPGPG